MVRFRSLRTMSRPGAARSSTVMAGLHRRAGRVGSRRAGRGDVMRFLRPGSIVLAGLGAGVLAGPAEAGPEGAQAEAAQRAPVAGAGRAAPRAPPGAPPL